MQDLFRKQQRRWTQLASLRNGPFSKKLRRSASFTVHLSPIVVHQTKKHALRSLIVCFRHAWPHHQSISQRKVDENLYCRLKPLDIKYLS